MIKLVSICRRAVSLRTQLPQKTHEDNLMIYTLFPGSAFVVPAERACVVDCFCYVEDGLVLLFVLPDRRCKGVTPSTSCAFCCCLSCLNREGVFTGHATDSRTDRESVSNTPEAYELYCFPSGQR